MAQKKKKGIFARLVDRIDKKMEKKAVESCSCNCDCKEKKKK